MRDRTTQATKRTKAQFLNYVCFVHFLLCLPPASVSADAPTLRESEVQGRRAWVIENGAIRVSLLRSGGHIAEVRLIAILHTRH